jgi:histone H3/H4
MSIPVYPKDDKMSIAAATVLSEDDIEQSDAGSNKESVSDEDVEVEMAGNEEDSLVVDAVAVSTEINENENVSKEVTKTEEDEMTTATVTTTTSPGPTKSRKRKRQSGTKEEGIPSVKDLGIPFRAIKRIMKIDHDIATVQNEAAMVTTFALELFINKIVNESYSNAKKRGRNTVK